MIARLAQLGVDVVMRQHQTRQTDFRRGKRLGARDHVVQWDRPPRPKWMAEAEYGDMPATLTMREMRSGGWTLVSTLTDARAVTKRELLDLYNSRWHVELDFRSIKDVRLFSAIRGRFSGKTSIESQCFTRPPWTTGLTTGQACGQSAAPIPRLPTAPRLSPPA